MKKQLKYSPEVIERAVRMVSEAASEYESQRAAITSITAKIGSTPETLRRGYASRIAILASAQAPQLPKRNASRRWREVRELRKANEILRLAGAFFAQAELDRHFKP